MSDLGGDFGVGSWIERRARVTPGRTALATDARTLSYEELASRIRRLAGSLRRLGVERGDRVAWLGPNHPAFLETLFAVARLGAALAPVNHRLDATVRAAVLADIEPVVVVEHAMPQPTSTPSMRHRVVVGGPITSGAIDHEGLIAGAEDREIDVRVGLDELVLLPHTSGTTGQPKAVMLSHGNVTWNAVNFVTCADFRAEDVTIAIAPFFRAGGTGVNVLPVLFLGGTVVIPDDASADGILRATERHRVSVGFGNPDLLDALVAAPAWSSAGLDSLRFVITGGAPVPERLIRAFLDRGVPLLQGYGLSEAGPLALLLDPEHALEKLGSAGKPPLFVDTRIVSADGSPVPVGAIGELQVRGPNVMAGYWQRPTDNARVLVEGGWLRTGDAARADGDGYVWIVDRLEAGFEVDGEVVYPGDVERVLLALPSVADVGVVGLPAPSGRTTVVALVVPAAGEAPTEAGLLEACAGRLPPHELPQALAFVESLPRNAVGKLVRQDLAALARAIAGGTADRPAEIEG